MALTEKLKTDALHAIERMDLQIVTLREALRWCLDEGLDEYVHETELQRLAEYRALLLDPLTPPEAL